MGQLFLYPSCLAVSGYSRSIIQDLGRGEYIFSPLWLTDLLQKTKSLTVESFRNYLAKVNEEHQYENYLNFLIENKIVYRTEKVHRFCKIPLQFEIPALISNSIIIFNDNNYSELKTIINELEGLGCESVQLYLPIIENLTSLEKILSAFNKTIIQHLEIILKYNSLLVNNNKISDLFSNYNRLVKLHFTDSSENKKLFVDVFHIRHILYSVEQFDFANCGVIHPMLFKNNLPFFTESQKHNTCLNRKLCIDSGGNIKNCPAMKETFGNSKTDSLREVIRSAAFQELWHIPKDKIEICKDCEFRHMCMDCRAFITNPQNRFSQPQKCTYNPYICKWEGEEGYIPVAACGHYNDKDRFIPDRQKIEKINAGLWEEK